MHDAQCITAPITSKHLYFLLAVSSFLFIYCLQSAILALSFVHKTHSFYYRKPFAICLPHERGHCNSCASLSERADISQLVAQIIVTESAESEVNCFV
jgi:hypothetical protein